MKDKYNIRFEEETHMGSHPMKIFQVRVETRFQYGNTEYSKEFHRDDLAEWKKHIKQVYSYKSPHKNQVNIFHSYCMNMQ